MIKTNAKRILSLLFKVARKLPSVANIEHHKYSHIENNLHGNYSYIKTGFFAKKILNVNIIRDSILRNSVYRIIDPQRMSEDDKDHLQVNNLYITNILKNKDSVNTDFQVETLASKYISAICPSTGVKLQSNKSFLAEPGGSIFYPFTANNNTFYLVVGRDGMGYIKLYLYFYHIQTVVLLGDKDWAWLGRWEIDIFRSYLIKNCNDALDYINNTESNLCMLIDQPHFAHHIWNTLTGINKIVLEKKQSLPDRYIISHEPMGPIKQIFPEIDSTKISTTKTIDNSLTNNLFLLRLGGTSVNNDIVSRIHHAAEESSSHEYIQSANKFREKHFPILWATIRTNGRAWVSQAEGIANIANKFKEIYPNFGLIIDGYAIPYGNKNLSKAIRKCISDELELKNEINLLLNPCIDVKYIVGEPMFKSVIYSKTTDFYLANHGAIQHKINWLSNKPGVAHSNRSILARVNKNNKSRHNIAAVKAILNHIPPTYIDSNYVTDLANESGGYSSKNRWDAALENYDLDWQHAFEELNNLIANSTPKRNSTN